MKDLCNQNKKSTSVISINSSNSDSENSSTFSHVKTYYKLVSISEFTSRTSNKFNVCTGAGMYMINKIKKKKKLEIS